MVNEAITAEDLDLCFTGALSAALELFSSFRRLWSLLIVAPIATMAVLRLWVMRHVKLACRSKEL